MRRETPVFGRVRPRLYTKELRPLTRETSLGFEIMDWAREHLDWVPMPHQIWILVHLFELNPDGSPRFRKALITMARQNAKTSTAKVIILWALAQNRSSLFSSASLDTARKTWEQVLADAESIPSFGRVKKRATNGQWTVGVRGAEFAVVSANRRAARGRTASYVFIDETREHFDYEALEAAESTTLTIPDAIVIMMSNAGDRRAVPLAHYRALGMAGTEDDFFFAEWSAEEDAELDDIEAWRSANPGLGRTITVKALRGLMSGTAAGFRTENLNVSVPSLNVAVSPQAWDACEDVATLDAHRSRVALCFDLSDDLRHATLCAAATMPDGRTRVEVVAQWESTAAVRKDLPDLVKRINPRSFGWFTTGPASAMATDLKAIRRQVELSGNAVTSVCQELAELTTAGKIAHSAQDVLTSHVVGAQKQRVGDSWRFSRRDGYCDAAFAAAGAVHLARQIKSSGSLSMVTAGQTADVSSEVPQPAGVA